LIAQFIGSASITIGTFAVGMALMYLVKMTGTLRVSEEGERIGIDLHEHGALGQPEYVLRTLDSGGSHSAPVHASPAPSTSKR
jgi:Amt family ammonium transporter